MKTTTEVLQRAIDEIEEFKNGMASNEFKGGLNRGIIILKKIQSEETNNSEATPAELSLKDLPNVDLLAFEEYVFNRCGGSSTTVSLISKMQSEISSRIARIKELK